MYSRKCFIQFLLLSNFLVTVNSNVHFSSIVIHISYSLRIT